MHHIILHKTFLQASFGTVHTSTDIHHPAHLCLLLWNKKGQTWKELLLFRRYSLLRALPKYRATWSYFRVVGEDKNPGFESCKASDLSAANKLLETLKKNARSSLVQKAVLKSHRSLLATHPLLTQCPVNIKDEDSRRLHFWTPLALLKCIPTTSRALGVWWESKLLITAARTC